MCKAGGHSQVIRYVVEISGNCVTKTFDDKPDSVHRAYNKVNGNKREHKGLSL